VVERVSLGFAPPDRADLRQKIAASIAKGMTDEELAEQRASFVYGNAPADSKITKDSARHAVAHTRIGVR